MIDSHKKLVQEQRKFFETHATLDIEFRKAQISNLLELVKSSEDKIFAALKSDLAKPEMESITSETGVFYEEAKLALKSLEDWMKPQKVSTPLIAQPGKSYIVPEPKGVVLVLSPWNYPIALALNPVVAALAAGNCVVLKPSEISSACTKVLCEIINQAFDPRVLVCLEGDAQMATELLKQRFDHIFFTGSTAVGKKVMHAAAEHLTPVTLELGGKSPCIVDCTASLDVAVRRIVWAKFLNAGQTCVAPDYVLVHESIFPAFLDKMKIRIQEEFGIDASTSPDYARIVNEKHFDRLLSYMSEGKIVCGGASKRAEKYIEPTVLSELELDSPVMKEEIFGPILPVLSYSDFSRLKQIIRDRADPLALYLFAEDKELEDRVLNEIPAGGVCINDAVIHVGCSSLPFGGRGASGMGAYHGKAGFDAFTHFKSVLDRSTLIDPNLRYRPYAKNIKAAKWFLS